MGRPSKLTPALQADLVAALEAGHPIATAAALAGIGETTVHRWRQLGEDDDAPPRYREFREALTRARAKACAILVNAAMADAVGGIETRRVLRADGTLIVQTTPPNGRLALEMLARMSLDWRPVKAVAVEVSTPVDGGRAGMLDDEELKRLAAKISAVRQEHEARAEAAGSPG
ncbi:hypothetical protein ABT061_23355 [Streptosporangium sp. NPDC002544]|uniref:hypothetical protein n=1 Tax=Streptosporangium sp. NPDC002544 TaxID=3154538 RepID=UPI0033326461